MKKYFITIFIFMPILIFSQTKNGAYRVQMLFPVAYDINNLTIRGFSGSVKSDLSNLSSANPALISDFDKISGSLSFSYPSTNTTFLYGDIGLGKYKPYIPNNFTILFPFNSFQIAGAYNQRFFSSLDFGNIQVTTENQPDGTGETYSPDFYTLVNEYSIILGSSTFEVGDDDKLSFGLNFNLNHLIIYEKIFRSQMKFEQIRPSFSIGINYVFNEKYRVNFFYSHRVKFSGTSKFEGPDLLRLEGNPRGGQNYKIDSPDLQIIENIPSSFSLGILITETEFLNYYFQYSREFWNTAYVYFSDSHNYSSGVSYRVSDGFIFSTGINYLYQKQDPNEIFDGNLSALYLNFGSIFYFDQFNFSAVLADSHISNSISSDITSYRRKQTLFKLAIGYAF